MDPAPAPGLEAVLSDSGTPWPHSTLHQADDGGGLRCSPSPCSLGNLSKPRELLHYLQPPFASHGTYQEPSAHRPQCLCSVQPKPPRNWHLGLPVQELGSPCPSLSEPTGPPHLPAEGHRSREHQGLAGHFSRGLGSETT